MRFKDDDENFTGVDYFTEEDFRLGGDHFLVSSMKLVRDRYKFSEQIDEIDDGEYEPDLALDEAWEVLEAVVRIISGAWDEPINQRFYGYLSLAHFIGLTLYMPNEIACKFTKITIWRGIMCNIMNIPYEDCQGEDLVEFRRLISKCELKDLNKVLSKLQLKIGRK